MKEIDTEYGFTWWLSKAKKGERVVYFDGFLMLERQRLVMNGFTRDQFPQKIKTAILAWKAYMDGLVTLTQRKRDDGEYEYIATRS